MTQKERIESLKETIKFLYEKEGRSKSYIARLLFVDRKSLMNAINEWGLVQGNTSYLTPSNQKFANKNKQMIKSRLDNNISISDIARELNVGRHYLSNIINKTNVLKTAKECYEKRAHENSIQRANAYVDNSKLNYFFEEIDGEVWKEILGYEDYFVSNFGRVKSYKKSYGRFALITQQKNSCNGRMYVKIKGKGLQVSRLVGFAFVDGYSEKNNTIGNIDKDICNNKASNLRWVSQSENNRAAYKRGKKKPYSYTKNGSFKKIMLDDKYEFKTITAFAKFVNVSETQASRYISKECSLKDHSINLVY